MLQEAEVRALCWRRQSAATVLFVGTKRQARDRGRGSPPLRHAYVDQRWLAAC